MTTIATLLGQVNAPLAIGAQFYSARQGQSVIFAFEVIGDLAEATEIARRMEAAGNQPAPAIADQADQAEKPDQADQAGPKRKPKK